MAVLGAGKTKAPYVWGDGSAFVEYFKKRIKSLGALYRSWQLIQKM